MPAESQMSFNDDGPHPDFHPSVSEHQVVEITISAGAPITATIDAADEPPSFATGTALGVVTFSDLAQLAAAGKANSTRAD